MLSLACSTTTFGQMYMICIVLYVSEDVFNTWLNSVGRLLLFLCYYSIFIRMLIVFTSVNESKQKLLSVRWLFCKWTLKWKHAYTVWYFWFVNVYLAWLWLKCVCGEPQAHYISQQYIPHAWLYHLNIYNKHVLSYVKTLVSLVENVCTFKHFKNIIVNLFVHLVSHVINISPVNTLSSCIHVSCLLSSATLFQIYIWLTCVLFCSHIMFILITIIRWPWPSWPSLSDDIDRVDFHYQMTLT